MATIATSGMGQSATRQLEGSTHDINGLQGLSQLEASTDQNRVELVVDGATDISDHGVVEGHGTLQLPVVDAGLHQASVDLNVGSEIVLLAEALNEFESLAQATGVTQNLDQDAQRVIGRRNSRGLHLLQDLQGVLHAVLLGAAIQDAVVHDLVRAEFAVLLHLLQDMEGPVHVALQAIALDDGGVGDDVRLHAGLGHVLQEVGGPAHGTGFGTCIQHGVVGDGVAGNFVGSHLVVDGEDLVQVFDHSKSLQNRGVDHGVDAASKLLAVHLLPDQLPGLLGLVVHDQGLGQAAQSDGGGLHTLFLHLRPKLHDALGVTSLSVGLDHGAVGGGRELDAGALLSEALHEFGEDVEVLDADAGLHHRGEEDLVDGVLQVLDEAAHATEVRHLGVAHQGLQDDGAGDGVGLHTSGLHLLHDAPHAAAVLGHHGRVEELVVGDLVGAEALAVHLLHEVPGLLGLPAAQKPLQQGVVAHGVQDLQLLHLLEVGPGAVQVPALDAGIQEAVVDEGRQVVALAAAELLEGLRGGGQVPVLGEGLDGGSAALDLGASAAGASSSAVLESGQDGSPILLRKAQGLRGDFQERSAALWAGSLQLGGQQLLQVLLLEGALQAQELLDSPGLSILLMLEALLLRGQVQDLHGHGHGQLESGSLGLLLLRGLRDAAKVLQRLREGTLLGGCGGQNGEHAGGEVLLRNFAGHRGDSREASALQQARH
mmetsp:Transcript_39085/g.83169  ORF Transcript_39085/g.83169 Transcript_39085/m.83169 type:complete len:712 (+) Transcript_39085:298-2433(+)